jgi:uncharacterized protein YndB with AHSA1/START domain
MANVFFTVEHRFAAPAEELWRELTDWSGHGNWIPATRMEVSPGDPRRVGATFVAYTGYGPVVLEDRMEVTQIDWDAETSTGVCEVTKLGPVLTGTAGFTVAPDGDGSRIDWIEDVEVPYVPGFLAPVVARVGALGFSQGMRSLAKLLTRDRVSS